MGDNSPRNGKNTGIREKVVALAESGVTSPSEIARIVGIARQNVYLHLPENLRPRAVKRIEANDQPTENPRSDATSTKVPDSLPTREDSRESV